MKHITADTLSGLHGVANQIKIVGLALSQSHQKVEDEQLETRNLFQRLSLLLVMRNSSLLINRAPDEWARLLMRLCNS